MSRLFIFTTALIMAVASVSCESERVVRPGPCTADFRPGLEVEAVDADSGEPVVSGALIVAVDGQFVDTLSVCASTADGTPIWACGAGERPGNYTVSVEKSGYKTWIQPNVRVDQDRCHVITVRLRAQLATL